MSPPNIAANVSFGVNWMLHSQVGGATLPLSRFPAVLGRRPDNEICVPEPSVSGRHAEFQRQRDALVVRDLGSTNGTFVNGHRIHEPRAVTANDLLHFGEAMFRLLRREPGEATEVNATSCALDVCDQALALVQFDRLLSDRAVTPYYQPIVAATNACVAYEVLGRSPLFGLNTPGPMFRAAAALNKEAELSRVLRIEALRGELEPTRPHLFLNTHPREMEDVADLILSLHDLRRLAPQQPLTLEIHESAVVGSKSLQTLRVALNDLCIGLAYDDFGAGQARLAELVDTSPDVVKFDMRLIRRIHIAPEPQRKMVRSLVQMVRELNIVPLAEGVECAEEAEVCCELGFDLFQGYFYGRPGPVTQYFDAGTDRGFPTTS